MTAFVIALVQAMDKLGIPLPQQAAPRVLQLPALASVPAPPEHSEEPGAPRAPADAPTVLEREGSTSQEFATLVAAVGPMSGNESASDQSQERTSAKPSTTASTGDLYSKMYRLAQWMQLNDLPHDRKSLTPAAIVGLTSVHAIAMASTQQIASGLKKLSGEQRDRCVELARQVVKQEEEARLADEAQAQQEQAMAVTPKSCDPLPRPSSSSSSVPTKAPQQSLAHDAPMGAAAATNAAISAPTTMVLKEDLSKSNDVCKVKSYSYWSRKKTSLKRMMNKAYARYFA
ncbi:hypothetical protein CYMTET_12720 [Cymbomonas tetramitiformis]|uniref:Uncharacterized protein n=1 Tax=Cymbomonas tetramitiformis TaxID=36881 RepID=A0AAE0GL45_9CHLO|nr:hypothetical protein CYMTET_12720 [Cymbomonas tetramitiformis]